jgi:S1 RNA binding domain protein
MNLSDKRRTIIFMPTEQANIVPGEIIEGKVQGITNFGAFIELAGGIVGLVHISEIADTYVKDVRDFIQVGEQVKVKVLNVSGNKIGLSIKLVSPENSAFYGGTTKGNGIPLGGQTGSRNTKDNPIKPEVTIFPVSLFCPKPNSHRAATILTSGNYYIVTVNLTPG